MGHGVNGVPHHNYDARPADVFNWLGHKQDPYIVEVGCNDGETTASFLQLMPQATIQCFEPDPRPIKRFIERFGAHHPQVFLHTVAASDRNSVATFHQSGGPVPHSTAPCKDDWDYSGSLHVPTGHLERDKVVKFPTTISVLTKRLDDVPALHLPDRIDLIWADVQGAEARLILGAQRILRSTRYLYIEYYDVEQYARQPDMKALLSFLPDWDLIATYCDNALLKNRDPL